MGESLISVLAGYNLSERTLSMKTILVTGSKGQLGCCLQDLSGQYLDNYRFIFADIEELDIANIKSVEPFFRQNKIDIVINAAAYTQVDLAEVHASSAFLINSTGVSNLVKMCKLFNIFLVHISTDFVFDGRLQGAYTEDQLPNPISEYGKSKLAGEQEVLESGIRSIILRTSWLYSKYGKNFLKTILKIAQEREEIKVISDQKGTPTYGRDLAEIIIKLIAKEEAIKGSEIFHYSNSGECSWYEFAQLIVELSGQKSKVIPILEEEYPTVARRPKNSVLSKEKLKKFLNIEIPTWEEGVKKCIREIL
jgi:dTDP-4-dehydrorhamnose reductase